MKIFFAVPKSGCAFWRCVQPAKMMKKKGLADVRIFDPCIMSEDDIQEHISWADIIVQQSAMGIETVASVAKMKNMGKTVIGDYDDLSFSLSPFNPAYKTLGLTEVTVQIADEKPQMLWKDGENGFSIKANYFRYRSLQDLLKLFHAVTTTGRFIKNKYAEFSNNVFILPNSIDFNLFKPFERRENKQIRIGWTASDSHYAEIWMVKRIMRRIFDKYGDKVKFVVMGNLTELEKEFNPNELERHDFVPLDVYPLKLATMNFDLAICPLFNIDFNRAKSCLKWSEMAAMKTPCVVQKLDPYDCVEDGRTGLIASTEDEFVDKISELVDDKEKRIKIASNAFDKNYADYNLETNIDLWIEAYEQAREICSKQPSSEWEASESDTQKILKTSDIQ